MPRQNTSPADYPRAVLQQIENLAQNIVIARKRRGESQAQWAKRLGVSQPTMARIERGDPSVAMASYVMCMWLVNQAEGLADLIAPLKDHAALEREVSKVQAQRKRAPSAHAPSRAAERRSALPLAPQPVSAPSASVARLAVREPEPSLAPTSPPTSPPTSHLAERHASSARARNDHAAGLAALLGKPPAGSST